MYKNINSNDIQIFIKFLSIIFKKFFGQVIEGCELCSIIPENILIVASNYVVNCTMNIDMQSDIGRT